MPRRGRFLFFNGIDLRNSIPTGRFSNGFNTAEQIVRLLGYKRSPPPYYCLVHHPSTFKQNILYGINFASGGAGILKETGQTLYHKVISMTKQIQQFSYVREVITNMTGSEQAANDILSKAFFLISVGSNDLFDYLNNQTASSQEFLETTLTAYQSHIMNLCELGARKFGILGVPPIECCPYARDFMVDGNCSIDANNLAQGFYNGNDDFFSSFSYAYLDVKYSLGNIFQMTTYIIDDPLAVGFKNVASACCGNAANIRNRTATLCDDHHGLLFWDRYHPTEAASELAALTLFGGLVELVKPVNFSQLLQVNGQEIFH